MSLIVSSSEIPIVAATPNIWDSYATPIEYGLCQTDYKPHKNHYRELNHIYDHHGVIKTHLSDIGLPYRPQDFLVGKKYDLLFLKNHGIVIKVGTNHNPVDLIHPCFSQPLWWATDVPSGITTCVYAGEKLSPETPESHDKFEFLEIVAGSKQMSGDMIEKANTAFDGDLPIFIDVDAEYNRTICPEIRALKQELAAQWLNNSSVNNADGVQDVLLKVYGDNPTLEPWMQQFNRHQPLRRMFWDVQNLSGEDKREGLRSLWSNVESWTQDLPRENDGNMFRKLRAVVSDWRRSERPDYNGTKLHRDYLMPPVPTRLSL